MGGGQGRGRQRLRIGRKNGEGRGEKNTRRFSRNITVDFISCSNVNDVYDGPEILTYRNISLSFSLFLKGSQRDDFVSVEKGWRELSFPFDERKISVCGLSCLCCALSNWNFKGECLRGWKVRAKRGKFWKICDWCDGFFFFFFLFLRTYYTLIYRWEIFVEF